MYRTRILTIEREAVSRVLALDSPETVERLHAAMARTEAELVRQGIVLGRDADLSDYADAILAALRQEAG